MRSHFVRVPLAALALASMALGTACNDSEGFIPPDSLPLIVTASGPTGGVVTCDPNVGGGACPLPIAVTFRLPKDQFVWKAYVRFQGDGSDVGVDHGYTFGNTFGNDTAGVVVNVAATIPVTILRRGALFNYSVRLVSGMGNESLPSTLTVSVQ